MTRATVWNSSFSFFFNHPRGSMAFEQNPRCGNGMQQIGRSGGQPECQSAHGFGLSCFSLFRVEKVYGQSGSFQCVG